MEPTHIWRQTQYADTDKADLVDAKSTLYVQQVCGTFLYYAIAVDQTILSALNAISVAQANAMGGIVWQLHYAPTQPDATINYHARDMILHVASDACYLCEERARI